MKTSPASALSRSLRPLLVLVVGVLAVAWWFGSEPEPPATNTDARIAWYRARVGGRGTYPLYARLGLAYLQKARESGQGQWYGEAERQLRTSLDYQVNYEALLGMGMVLAARHEFAEAQRYADQAAAAMPESLEAQGLQFEIALARGDLEKAGAVVQDMVGRAPSTFEASSREAAYHEYRGRLSDALASIEAACGDVQRRPLPVATRAWCEVRHGALLLAARCDAAGAEQAYQKALATLPNYYFAREHLAELRAAQGNRSEAAAMYEALMRDAPAPGYRLALADVDELEGKAELAETLRRQANDDLWRDAVRGSREHVAEHAVLLAEMSSGSGEALGMIESEWESRKDTITTTALARVYVAGGIQQEAELAIGKAMASGTRRAGVLLAAAEIYLQGGRREEARKLLEQATACAAALTPGEQLQAKKLRAALTE